MNTKTAIVEQVVTDLVKEALEVAIRINFPQGLPRGTGYAITHLSININPVVDPYSFGSLERIRVTFTITEKHMVWNQRGDSFVTGIGSTKEIRICTPYIDLMAFSSLAVGISLDDCLNPYTSWLSNTLKLLSFVDVTADAISNFINEKRGTGYKNRGINSDCKYFDSDVFLQTKMLCAVNPTNKNCEGCKDYAPKEK